MGPNACVDLAEYFLCLICNIKYLAETMDWNGLES